MLTIYQVQRDRSVMQCLLKLPEFPFFSQGEMCVRRRDMPQFLGIYGGVLRPIEVFYFESNIYFFYFYNLRVIFKQSK